jgi:hypothetical protein
MSPFAQPTGGAGHGRAKTEDGDRVALPKCTTEVRSRLLPSMLKTKLPLPAGTVDGLIVPIWGIRLEKEMVVVPPQPEKRITAPAREDRRNLLRSIIHRPSAPGREVTFTDTPLEVMYVQ